MYWTLTNGGSYAEASGRAWQPRTAVFCHSDTPLQTHHPPDKAAGQKMFFVFWLRFLFVCVATAVFLFVKPSVVHFVFTHTVSSSRV
jgi:hypothetical protein